jgi:hypothetical protein
MTDALYITVASDQLSTGVAIHPKLKGYGLFATKRYSPGEFVIEGPFIVSNKTRFLGANFYSISNKENNTKQMDNPHSGMWLAHSCDPNTHPLGIISDIWNYQMIAVIDIEVGDEITCDHTLFQYECKTIIHCECRSFRCLRSIAGFKHLTLEEQLHRLPNVCQSVINEWLGDKPDLRYFDFRSLIPDTISVVEDGVNLNGHLEHKIIANRDFAPGEIIFTNESVYMDDGLRIIGTIPNSSFEITFVVVGVNRGNGKREFFGFDSFMNHSCEPNSMMEYRTRTAYTMVCCKPIMAGEDVTCDYEIFDDKLDGNEFQCLCGTPSCRKIIKG